MALLIIEPIVKIALEITKAIVAVQLEEFAMASPEQKVRFFELRLRSMERADKILEYWNDALFPDKK